MLTKRQSKNCAKSIKVALLIFVSIIFISTILFAASMRIDAVEHGINNATLDDKYINRKCRKYEQCMIAMSGVTEKIEPA